MKWLMERFKERSTYLGLTAVAASFGFAIGPEFIDAIIQIATGVAGIILITMKDRESKK